MLLNLVYPNLRVAAGAFELYGLVEAAFVSWHLPAFVPDATFVLGTCAQTLTVVRCLQRKMRGFQSK